MSKQQMGENVKILPLDPTPHPERPFGLWNLTPIASGMVISTAVFSLQAPATAMAGRASWIAYIVAIVLGFLVVLPNLMVCGAMVFPGGDYGLVSQGLGKLPSGIYAWNFIMMNIGVAMTGVALNQYVVTLWPGAPGKIISIIILCVFFVLNIAPIKVISRFQNVMFAAMIIAMATYIIFGATKLLPGTFDVGAEGYFRGGSKGFTNAVVTLVFSTTNYVTVMAMSPFAKNPRKHVPWAMIFTAIIILVLYPLMALISSNTVPIDDVAGKSMIVVAKQILPGGLFIFFLVCGPFLAATTTLNSTFLNNSKPFEQSTDKGWFPKKFSWKNRFGSPVLCVSAIFLACLIPNILTDDVATVANSTNMVQLVLKIFTLAAAWRIPKLFPKFWETGLFRKIPKSVFYVIMTICTIVQLGLIIASARNLTSLQVTVSVVCMVVLTAACLLWYRSNRGKVNTEINPEELS